MHCMSADESEDLMESSQAHLIDRPLDRTNAWSAYTGRFPERMLFDVVFLGCLRKRTREVEGALSEA